jgi:hypothetical protein|tara:strand:- start:1696 stop:1896 length:201 start_codon:yes stop_codon:yes gene_type:complete
MNPERLDKWRIIPRLIMLSLIVMTFRVIEWFISLPDPSLEQAALPSVMTGALTGAFAVFLGSGKKE